MKYSLGISNCLVEVSGLFHSIVFLCFFALITEEGFLISPCYFLELWKRSVFIPNPKMGNAKECSNYCKIMFFSHASKVILKNHLARPEQYMNQELPDVLSGFRKGRGTRDQIANICWIIEKAREKAIAPHSSTLAWKIPWTDEPGGLQSMVSSKLSDSNLLYSQ